MSNWQQFKKWVERSWRTYDRRFNGRSTAARLAVKRDTDNEVDIWHQQDRCLECSWLLDQLYKPCKIHKEAL